ncbi:MAG: DUF2752 domain-containing protein [Flavobacteriaceae bacterium]|nr:DUF2752 domain-containing protein [Flavobacteriaceae bacterium]
MLPCLNKQLFGVDCLGCGMQRSLLLLSKGEVVASFKMYPAIFTLILLATFILLNWKFKFRHSQKIISILVILNITIIIVSYLIKINK